MTQGHLPKLTNVDTFLDGEGQSIRMEKFGFIYLLTAMAKKQAQVRDITILTVHPSTLLQIFKKWDPPIRFNYSTKIPKLLFLRKQKIQKWLDDGGGELLNTRPNKYFIEYKDKLNLIYPNETVEERKIRLDHENTERRKKIKETDEKIKNMIIKGTLKQSKRKLHKRFLEVKTPKVKIVKQEKEKGNPVKVMSLTS